MIEKKTKSMRFFESFAQIILRYRWLAVLGVILVTAFFFVQMQGLKFDGSFELWFVEGEPAMERLKKFKDNFGNDHFVYILIETDDFFQTEIIRRVGKLSSDLEQNIPYLRDITWLGNAEYMEPTVDGINILKLFETVPATPEEIVQNRAKAMGEPDFVDRLISEDGKTTAILIELGRYPDNAMNPEIEVAQAVSSVLTKPAYSDLKVYVVGQPVFESEYNKIAGKETPMFFGLSILIQLCLLIWVTRSIRGVVLPLLVVILSVFWTFGAIGLFGFDLNLMIIGLPVLLICVGIGDSMHVISEINDRRAHGCDRKHAIVKAVTMVGLPCMLTSLTTALGFLAFASAPITPFRQMGLYLPVGVIGAVILTLILVPFAYSFGKDGKKESKNKPIKITAPRHDLCDRFLEWIYRTVVTYPKIIIAVFTILFVLAVIGTCFVETESNTNKLLTRKIPIRMAMDYVDSNMGGSMSLEIILDTGMANGVKRLDFIQKMQTLETHIAGHHLVKDTSCVLDVLKKTRRALHKGQDEYYKIPDSSQAVSEYFFMYEMSGGDQMDKWVSFESDIARLNVRTKALSTKDIRQLMADVKTVSAQIFGDSVRVYATGSVDGTFTLNDNMALGQKRSFILAFCLITIVMILMMRSVKLGLISMIPNILPVFMVLGVLGFTGIYMDMILMSVSAMVISVAVDDTIHFFVRYRHEFARLGRYDAALKATLSSAGRPICFTTMTLALGFSVLMLSNMTGWISIGGLAGFAFIWALLADLFFAPAVLLVTKPMGKEQKTE